MSQRLLARLREAFGDAIVETHSELGDDTAVVAAARWQVIARFCRDDNKCAMDHFIDLTAVDYLGRRGVFSGVGSGDTPDPVCSGETPTFGGGLTTPTPDAAAPRFEVVLHLRSTSRLHRLRLKARLGEPPAIATLSSVWSGANWFERECYDMFGVRFTGHPDLRRILMYEEFEGYPLRRDYPASQTQPLVAYRSEALGKLPPFRDDEGLPFGRQTHASARCPDGHRRASARCPDGHRPAVGFVEE